MNKFKTFISIALLSVSSLAVAEPVMSSASDAQASVSTEQASMQVNLNTATFEQLQTLPGIGPKKAQAIINYRLEHSGFTALEQITSVPGIGAKLAQKLEGKIAI